MGSVRKVLRQAAVSKLLTLLLFQLCTIEAYEEVSLVEDYFTSCPQDILADSGVLYSKSDEYWLRNDEGFECEATISTYNYHSHRYYLSFDQFSIPTTGNTSSCLDHRLEIYEGSSRDPAKLIAKLCDLSVLEDYYLTDGNSVTVYLYRESGVPTANFRLKFLGFNNDPDADSLGTCFYCEDEQLSICVDPDMKCNGYEECPNGFDESLEENGGCGAIRDIISLALIIGIVVPVVIVLAIIIGVIICCCCCYRTSQAASRGRTTVVTSGGSYPPQTYAPGTQPGYQTPAGSYPQQPQGAYPPPQGAYPPPQGGYPTQPPPAYPPQQPPPGYPPPGQGVGYSAEHGQVAFPEKA